MKTLRDLLTLSQDYLNKKGVQNPRRQAEDLLADALSISRINLYGQIDCPLQDHELDLCREMLRRRSLREPLAYITGKIEFFSCILKVDGSVLIPRQETEILVDMIVKSLEKEDLTDKVLWDVCCGSGCIAIALKKRFPELTVFASDLSPQALDLARSNAHDNGVDLQFLQGDLLQPFAGKKTDYLVCNPPYIAESEKESLEPEVRDFEPLLALISGPTGLECYESLKQTLPPYLNSAAKIWFEIGCGQGKLLETLFSTPPWTQQMVKKDWAGLDRFFLLEID